MFLYVAQTGERVLTATFGNKLCWFESNYRHVSLCSPGRWTRVSSCLRKKTVGSSHTIGMFLYVAQAVERVLAASFGKELCRFESDNLHICLYSTVSWRRVSSCLRKHIVLVRVPLSAYFFMCSKHLIACLQLGSDTFCVGSIRTIGIFLYVENAVENVSAAASLIKLCCFESHYQHDCLCSRDSWTCVGSCLQIQTQLVRVPLSACLFMYMFMDLNAC